MVTLNVQLNRKMIMPALLSAQDKLEILRNARLNWKRPLKKDLAELKKMRNSWD